MRCDPNEIPGRLDALRAIEDYSLTYYIPRYREESVESWWRRIRSRVMAPRGMTAFVTMMDVLVSATAGVTVSSLIPQPTRSAIGVAEENYRRERESMFRAMTPDVPPGAELDPNDVRGFSYPSERAARLRLIKEALQAPAIHPAAVDREHYYSYDPGLNVVEGELDDSDEDEGCPSNCAICESTSRVLAPPLSPAAAAKMNLTPPTYAPKTQPNATTPRPPLSPQDLIDALRGTKVAVKVAPAPAPELTPEQKKMGLRDARFISQPEYNEDVD